MTEVRGAKALVAYQRLFRTPGEDMVPPDYGFDFHLFRTRLEVRYMERLGQTTGHIWAHVGVLRLLRELILWARPIGRAEFRCWWQAGNYAFF